MLTTGNKPDAWRTRLRRWVQRAIESCRHVYGRGRHPRLCVLACLVGVIAVGLWGCLANPGSIALAQGIIYTSLQQTVQPTIPPRPTLEPTMPPRPTPGSTLAPRPTLVPTVIQRPTLVPPSPTDAPRPAPSPEAQPTPESTPALLPVSGGTRRDSAGLFIGLISGCGVFVIGASLVLRRKAR